VLLRVIDRSGFPPCVGRFFRSYLVGRCTTYKWNAFMSGPYPADVGVGQGSVLSPVLSSLCVAPILKLFSASDIGHQVNVMSYVDDGTLIAHSPQLEDNLEPLKEAYGWVYHAFTSLGLVLEHTKSKSFHFTRARGNPDLPIDLGFQPFTGDTPLRPKATWHYLRFYFDQKLLFKEHIRFYTTRALTTVQAMGMLGNSVRGLAPTHKRLLYRSCVVPVMTYGLRLWYYWGAHVSGSIKALSRVQSSAVRWITGCFRTSPVGGMESLAGLLPMHLLLRRLADRGVLCVPLLAPSHPLRTVLGGPSLGSFPAHRLGLGSGGGSQARPVLGPLVDSAGAAADLHRDEYDPFGPDSAPGSRVLDVFPSRVIVRWSLSSSDEDAAAFRTELDGAWAAACVDPTCTVVSADASVPVEANLQAVACALVFWQGMQVRRVVTAAGKCTPEEVECFSLQIGISAALSQGCSQLVVFSDSASAVETLLDPVPHSGQVFSLDACKAVRPWLAGDEACTLARPLPLGVGHPQEGSQHCCVCSGGCGPSPSHLP
jgi:Reverse transcriptase (RNA-dependent DNA polymerase)/Reverse transcriptase-like